MQASSRVTINTGILYARMAITVFISLYTTRLILDALGASDYGIFIVIASAIGMMGFLNSAMSAATQRFMSYAEGEGKDEKQIKIFNISVVLHFLIGIIVVLLMEGAGLFLFSGILEIPADRLDVAKLIFHFAVISTWFNILSVPYNAVLYAHENMLFMAVVETLDKLFRLGIAVYITYSPYGYDKLASFGLLIAATSFLLLVIRHIYCSGKYEEVRYGVRRYFDHSLFREMTGFAGWSFLSSSTSMVANYGQGIVMNMFFGPVVNAAQGVAGDLSGKLGSFSGTMRRALNPVIDKSEGAGDRNRMLRTSVLGGKMSFFLLAFFAIPVIIEMSWILDLWLKEVPEFAVIFCQLLLVRDLIEQLFITLSSSIAAVGDIRNFKIATSIIHALPLVLSYYLFTLGYPPYWLYIIFIIYSIINGTIILYFAKKLCGLPIKSFLKNTLLRSLFAFSLTILFAVTPLIYMHDGLLQYFTIVLISTISFCFSVWTIGLQKHERNIIIKLAFKIKRRIENMFNIF